MDKIKKIIALMLFATLLLPLSMTEVSASADSYEDASTFFNTVDDQLYHCEFSDQYFYYATRGKIGNPDKKRYGSIGWRITAEANGYSMYVDVDKDPEPATYMIHIHGETEGDYSYDLYKISYESISELMKNKDASTWAAINEADMIWYGFSAILSIKPGGSTDTASHVTSEDGNGGVGFDNMDHVYYVQFL